MNDRTNRMMTGYYAATILFVVLDFGFDVNIRVAFLDPWPQWRVAYYVLCGLILLATLRYPGWSAWLGIGESLLTLSLLIISMAMRVIIVTDEMITEGRGYPTLGELANFGIAAGIVYLGYLQHAQAVQRDFRDDEYP